MNESLWSNYFKDKNLPQLNSDITVDVLIIGGGITGLSCAYNLRNSNLKVALVERNKLYHGVTSKTTAKITYLQENIYSKIKKYVNVKAANLYYESQKEAIKLLKETIKKNKINCDFEPSESYLFTNNLKKVNKLNKEKKLLESFNNKVEVFNSLPESKKCLVAIKVDGTYVFNPIKYLNAITDICLEDNISIYENTKIEQIIKNNNNYICYTKNNKIIAKYVILALHYPYFLFPFIFPTKVLLEKSYVGAYKCSKNLKYNAINIDTPTKSIRFYKANNEIFKIELTASHNIALKNNELENFNNLYKIHKDKYDYMWSNIDIITNDYLPFIGTIDNNLFLATGYNTWGMTNATLAGNIIKDIILNRNNPYIDLFNPKRNINLGKIIHFPLILSSNIYSFLNSKINLNKSWYKNIEFMTKNNKSIAIYTDKNNKKHYVYTTCPHLKCSLIFNEKELTWDCPCHGSRFDIDGNCIEGPSNYNITYK